MVSNRQGTLSFADIEQLDDDILALQAFQAAIEDIISENAYVAANTYARHSHSNASILDQLTQDHIDSSNISFGQDPPSGGVSGDIYFQFSS